jgi:hypothetical protein
MRVREKERWKARRRENVMMVRFCFVFFTSVFFGFSLYVVHAAPKPAPPPLSIQMGEFTEAFRLNGVDFTVSANPQNMIAGLTWTDGVDSASASYQFNGNGESVLFTLSFNDSSGSQNMRFVHNSPAIGIEFDPPDFAYLAVVNALRQSSLGQSAQALRQAEKDAFSGQIHALYAISGSLCSRDVSKNMDLAAVRDFLQCSNDASTAAGALVVRWIVRLAIPLVADAVGCAIGCGSDFSCNACCNVEAACGPDGVPR